MAKRAKKITLVEFHAWLEGVEELSASDWSPNKEQWELIRTKIKLIAEPKPAKVATAAPPAVVPPHPQRMMQAHGVPVAPVSSPIPPPQIVNEAPEVDSSDGNYNSTFS